MDNDWVLLVDLKRRLRFPEYYASTNLGPYIVIVSKESKVCVIMKLTVPWEEGIKEAHEQNILSMRNRSINTKKTVAEHTYIKARWYSRKDLAEKIYKQPNACVAKTLAKVLPEASWKEELLEVIRAKAQCVQ